MGGSFTLTGAVLTKLAVHPPIHGFSEHGFEKGVFPVDGSGFHTVSCSLGSVMFYHLGSDVVQIFIAQDRKKVV